MNLPPLPDVVQPVQPSEAARELLRRREEKAHCRDSFSYFANTYCHVETKADGAGDWAPFHLWPAQEAIAHDMQAHRRLVILKARQLGLTWLCVAFALWLMLFHPIATVLLFSLRDEEAKDLLRRLRGMHSRLPPWMRQAVAGRQQLDNQHQIEFANGSTARALTNAGDSYTASLVVVDEADLLPRLRDLLESVKPTIADGGRIFLVSRADKGSPESPFKKIYRSAKAAPDGHWRPIFLPWNARPDRTAEWYAEEKRAALAETGSLDGFSGNYPATDVEALTPRTLDKRLAPAWLQKCYREMPALDGELTIPGLSVLHLPDTAHRYVIGADPAEGNPTSDESAACVIDVQTGQQAAVLGGKIEPSTFAHYLGKLAEWYNRAGVMVERQNHGHAVLQALPVGTRKLTGHDGKEGFLSSTLGKHILYDACADAIRNEEVTIHDFETFTQLASIEGNTLRAPDSMHDDRADAFALACVARVKPRPGWGDDKGRGGEGRTITESAPSGVFG